jgi:hypothetical protein
MTTNAQTISAAIELTLALITKATEISTVVAKAQGEGRTTLTPEEWQSITAADDAARMGLVNAIAAAKAEGR